MYFEIKIEKAMNGFILKSDGKVHKIICNDLAELQDVIIEEIDNKFSPKKDN